MKTYEEIKQVYRECYPQYDEKIIKALADCYYDGARDMKARYET